MKNLFLVGGPSGNGGQPNPFENFENTMRVIFPLAAVFILAISIWAFIAGKKSGNKKTGVIMIVLGFFIVITLIPGIFYVIGACCHKGDAGNENGGKRKKGAVSKYWSEHDFPLRVEENLANMGSEKERSLYKRYIEKVKTIYIPSCAKVDTIAEIIALSNGSYTEEDLTIMQAYNKDIDIDINETMGSVCYTQTVSGLRSAGLVSFLANVEIIKRIAEVINIGYEGSKNVVKTGTTLTIKHYNKWFKERETTIVQDGVLVKEYGNYDDFCGLLKSFVDLEEGTPIEKIQARQAAAERETAEQFNQIVLQREQENAQAAQVNAIYDTQIASLNAQIAQLKAKKHPGFPKPGTSAWQDNESLNRQIQALENEIRKLKR